MQTILASLRSHIDVLCENSTTDGVRRATGTKTKRLKAVTAINELLAKKSAVNALSAASQLEMLKGPQPDADSESVPLGWAELVSFLLVGVNNACIEAKSSKSVSKSGKATLKPEYMICLRSAISKAMRHGPSGVIRHITLVYLAFSRDWLSEPALRDLVADQAWQLVRDLLQDDENRAMLTPAFIRTWVDVCFEQLTGRGPLHHKSSVVSTIASDVFQLLAKPVPSYDVLTQSTRGVSISKMLGGDYSYSTICERCCLMMIVAESLPRREARELQVTSFRTLTQLLKHHAVNVLNSTALKSIINVALQPILSCWTDRRYHDPAVSLMRVLVSLAPNNAKLRNILRRRFLADTNDQSSSALLRAGFDVKEDFIQTAAACFSLHECLDFVETATSQKGHLILWLRVTYSIVSRRVLKKGISVLVSEVHLKDQIRKTILIMSDKLREKTVIRHDQCGEALRWIAKIVYSVCSLMQRLNSSSRTHPVYDPSMWKNIYQELWAHASRVKSGFRPRVGYTRGKTHESWFDIVVQSLSRLYIMDFFEPFHSPLAVPAAGINSNIQYPLSRVLRKGERMSFHEVRYLRNIIAKSGAPDNGGSHLRHQLLDCLIEACELQNLHSNCSSERLIDASCAILGLSRGECLVNRQVGHNDSEEKFSEKNEMDSLFYLHSFYCMNLDEESISGHGAQRTKELSQQIRIWHDDPPRNLTPLSRSTILERGFKQSGEERTMENFRTRTRHFAIDLVTAQSLERALLDKVKQSLKTPAKSTVSQDGDSPKEAVEDFLEDDIVHSSTLCASENYSFTSVAEAVRGIKAIILLGNYMLHGLQLGSIVPVKTSRDQETSTWDEIILVVSVLFRRLSRTSANLYVTDSTLTETMISVMVSLMKHVQAESNHKSLSHMHPGFVDLAQSILDTILSCSTTLSEYVVHLIEQRTKRNVQRIEFCSSNTCPVDHLTSSFGRKRRLAESRTSRKKRRISESPKRQLRTRRHDRFSDDDSSEQFVRSDQEVSLGHESVSSDDSDGFLYDFEKKGVLDITEDEENSEISGGSVSTICSATNVLRTILVHVEEAAPNIFSICEKGYESIKNVGSCLNPDGYERSSMLSDLVDDGFLTIRECLWSIFFDVGTYTSLIVAGEDILSFGVLWKEAEDVTRSYVSLHTETVQVQKRKYYPLPYKLEVTRVAFLEYSRIFMLKCSDESISGRLRQQLSSSDGALPRLITGILEVADHFRSTHAFRMPHTARASYLSFGITTMEVISKCCGALLDTRLFGPRLSSLYKFLNSTRSAILKFLTDPNGSVRVLAAHCIPRLLKYLHFDRIADMEAFVSLFLPDGSSCIDSTKYYRAESSLDVVEVAPITRKQWDLDVKESKAERDIHESFANIGSTSRGLTVIQSLVRTTLFQESLVAMFYDEVFQRVSRNPRLLSAAYYGFVRMSVLLVYESPKRLFDSFSRIVLYKWLQSNEPLQALRTFPVALVLDIHHHEEGIRFDWMRDYQGLLLPFFLVREREEHLPELKLASSFAKDLEIDLAILLSGNVSSFSLVYPMHFTETMHQRAQKLWNAIDTTVGGKSMKLMHQNKSEVIEFLLRSICTNFAKKKDLHQRIFNFETGLGFLRDTKGMKPPLYDPLVIALSINQLFSSNPRLFIISEVALEGSIFAEVRNGRTRNVIADSFTDFLKECQRKNGNLLHILIMILGLLVGIPCRQPSQNRLDSFFCLGVLWRMAGNAVLVKSASERKLFYMLIARGFEHPETVADAAWLLFDVWDKLVKLYETYPNLSVPQECNLSTEADIVRQIPQLRSSQEQGLYELLSTVSPVLVNVLVMTETDVSQKHQDIASKALKKLLSECQRLGLWSVILANGPMPAHHCFRHLRRIYGAARRQTETGSEQDPVHNSLSTISRFPAMYRLSGLDTSPAVLLGFLQELNATLGNLVMRRLSLKVRNEAWMRSSGLKQVTGIEIVDVLSCVTDLVHRISRSEVVDCGTPYDENYDCTPTLSICSRGEDLRNAILQESAALLSKLGLLNLPSASITSMRSCYRTIPPRVETGKYEDVLSGIELSMFLLQSMLGSPTPVVAQNAYHTLKAILQSKDGRHIFGLHREHFQTISILRGSDRAPDKFTKPESADILVDPQNGDTIPLKDLPDVTDVELWSTKRNDYMTPRGLDIWVRTFCSVLSNSCRSKAMQSLSRVCYSSYQASCAMLPYLFMDTICDFDTQRLSLISGLLKDHILNNRTAPKALRRLFIHTLDVLCQIGLDVVFKDGVFAWFQKTDKTYTFPCYYVFEIPYDEAASVALNCGSYFSVLRFAQLYIDQEEIQIEFSRPSKQNRGKQINPEIDDDRERRLAAVRARIEPLIREAMNRLSEPDGKTAFISNKNLASFSATAAIYIQDWPAALGALEADNSPNSLLESSETHIPSGKRVDQTCSGNVFPIDLNSELQKFQCFLRMGTLTVASDYWEALYHRLANANFKNGENSVQENITVIEQLNDLRYAAAWKLQRWESPKVLCGKEPSTTSMLNRRVGFHEALYHVLHSFTTERYMDACETILRARNSLLRQLVEDTTAMSTTKVFRRAAELSTLEFLRTQNPGNGVSSFIAGNPFLRLSETDRNMESNDESLTSGKRRVLEAQERTGADDAQKHGRYVSDTEVLLQLLDTGIPNDQVDAMPLANSIDSSILAEEVPAVLFRSLNKKSNVAFAVAASSARILAKGGTGCWARAASCLGTPKTALLDDTISTKKVAWRLQYSRLMWYSDHDARSRRKALDIVKAIITNDLHGKWVEARSEERNESEVLYQCIEWLPGFSADELLQLLRVETCCLAAEWSLDMRTHEPMHLFKTYLESGLAAAQQSFENQKLCARAHLAMASFANEQIRNIDVYRKSRTYEEMVQALQDMESKVERMRAMKEERLSTKKSFSLNRNHRSARSQMTSGTVSNKKISRELDGLILYEQKKARMDRARLEELDYAYRKWQLLACKHFAACLRAGTNQDLRAAFRLVAIWLDSGSMRETITAALTQNAAKDIQNKSIDVPASKLLPLAPQLASRLNFSEHIGPNLFQSALMNTITLMVSAFPAHCLWQILALSNSTRGCATDEKYTAFYRGDKDKKDAAEDIMKRLVQTHGPTVSQMKTVAEAYIAVSEIDPKQKEGKPYLNLKGYELMKLGELQHVPIPTIPLPICATDLWESLPHIHSFQQKATICAGLSRPLSIVCIGSDGKMYPQLVKGRDDLRGDAVMEQMFMIVNKLLQRDIQAAERNLLIRTYRIIPLSPFSGIMQFVDNTKQLKDVLVERTGKKGSRDSRRSLHERYRPKDLRHEAIQRGSFKEYDHRGRRDAVKLRKYLQLVWPKFQPVFRHFFMEEWPDPTQWFEHQLNYSRSVAVMSIVGFILGLGDRHLSNILLDVRTAEVVHIDFGISFEQGKLLATPEHMPFRLTRDIVDGFGVAGVEGVFRRCCEITLRVMRHNKDVLLTVIDVLLHDPMFTWALTPEEVLKEQGPSQGESDDIFDENETPKSFPDSAIDAVVRKVDQKVNGSRDAQRALYRISEKLDGLEGTERLSIEAHVARLIDEARAFHVISVVFPGWSPWV